MLRSTAARVVRRGSLAGAHRSGNAVKRLVSHRRFVASTGIQHRLRPAASWFSSDAAGADSRADADADAELFASFDDVPELHPTLRKNLKANLNIDAPTEIQSRTWTAASAGEDVLGRARTGTGKTVAFLLPALQRLMTQADPPKDTVRMLVLSPTRELAVQIDEQARRLLHLNQAGLHTQVMYGGTQRHKDVRMLEMRLPPVLIATPGRLEDHLNETKLNGVPLPRFFDKTSILVLDETDRLLDMGFRDQVQRIIDFLPPKEKRQSLLFSATLPPSVRSMMDQTMRKGYAEVDCIRDLDPATHTNAQVDQSLVVLPSESHQVKGFVTVLLTLYEQDPSPKIMVFFPTTKMVEFYAGFFREALAMRQDVMEIHSRKNQIYRTRVSEQFRRAKSGILFTSDVSARGVDFPNVTHVVQLGVPDSRETYIHRLGRTGRAEKSGRGILVLTDAEYPFMESEMKGLDVPVDSILQGLVSDDNSATEKRVDEAIASIQSRNHPGLQSSADAAYRSMLGFYRTAFSKMGEDMLSVIKFCNNFSKQTGMRELPIISPRMIQKMGLQKFAQHLNVGDGRVNADGWNNVATESRRGWNDRGGMEQPNLYRNRAQQRNRGKEYPSESLDDLFGR